MHVAAFLLETLDDMRLWINRDCHVGNNPVPDQEIMRRFDGHDVTPLIAQTPDVLDTVPDRWPGTHAQYLVVVLWTRREMRNLSPHGTLDVLNKLFVLVHALGAYLEELCAFRRLHFNHKPPKWGGCKSPPR